MAKITRRRTGELVRRLFEILLPYSEGMQAREALTALEKSVSLTDYEKGTYASGGRRFEKIVRFATVDCVKAGWLQKTKGRWIVTEAGKAALAQHSDPEAFYRRAVKLYYEWRSSQPDSAPEDTDEADDEAGGKAASITFEEAEEQAWFELEQYLKA